MSEESKTLVLEDGRDLGYGEWGASEGLPVFFFHGTPGSRILARAFHSAAEEKGIRLIGVDRPGYGLSTFQDSRTTLDYPKDVVQLADHLAIDGFGVMGASGGGPYVLACAHAMPDRVFGGLAICSVGPPESWNEVTREQLEANAENPDPLEQQLTAFPMMAEADRPGLLKNLIAGVQPKYRLVAEARPELLEAFIDHHVEGQRQGARGSIYEAQLVVKPWEFDLESIRVPVRIWCGSADPLATDARYMAEKLPESQLKIEEGAGHIDGLWITEELLDMMKALDPRSESTAVS